jgi:hypothetical protein
MVMVYAGGHVSGAHYNPAVAALTSKQIEARELGRRLAAGDWTDGQVGFEQDSIEIDGVNVWQHEWEDLHADVELWFFREERAPG